MLTIDTNELLGDQSNTLGTELTPDELSQVSGGQVIQALDRAARTPFGREVIRIAAATAVVKWGGKFLNAVGDGAVEMAKDLAALFDERNNPDESSSTPASGGGGGGGGNPFPGGGGGGYDGNTHTEGRNSSIPVIAITDLPIIVDYGG